MQSPYRESSWVDTEHEECSCSHACFACRTRVTKLAREAGLARARRRLGAIALLATGALLTTLTYECIGLTSAIERLAEATRQANSVALHRVPVRPPASAPAPVAPPIMPLRIGPGIIRVTDTEYLIDRRLVDLALEEQASLMASVRVVPASVHGKTYPRLFALEPDSLLGLLGFQNGDYLEAINGFDLSTPERALEAYARLRTADALEARVSRGGKMVTLVYRLW